MRDMIKSRPGFLLFEVEIGQDQGDREYQEDFYGSFISKDPQILQDKGCLFAVADGVGGHQAGEIASKMAIDIVIEEYFSSSISSNVEVSLKQAVEIANKKIYQQAMDNPQQKGMGTTFTGAVIRDNLAYVAQAGDSRAYMIRQNLIQQITHDHSFVAELGLSDEEAREHPQRNVITRSLGNKPEVEVDIFISQAELTTGDTLVLCSDGLCGVIGKEDILRAIQIYPLKEAAWYLVNLAKQRGAPNADNITVMLIKAVGVLEEGKVREPISFNQAFRERETVKIPKREAKKRVKEKPPISITAIIATTLTLFIFIGIWAIVKGDKRKTLKRTKVTITKKKRMSGNITAKIPPVKGAPVLSRDSEMIAFTTEEKIYVIDLYGGKTEYPLFSKEVRALKWSNKEEALFYIVESNANFEVMKVKPFSKTSISELFTTISKEGIKCITISSDAQKVAYIKSLNEKLKLFIKYLDSLEEEILTLPQDYISCSQIVFSPAGEKIACVVKNKSKQENIFVASVGQVDKVIYNTKINGEFPVFSPDGRALALISTGNAGTSIFLRTFPCSAGDRATQWSNAIEDKESIKKYPPAFSSDGDKIAFVKEDGSLWWKPFNAKKEEPSYLVNVDEAKNVEYPFWISKTEIGYVKDGDIFVSTVQKM